MKGKTWIGQQMTEKNGEWYQEHIGDKFKRKKTENGFLSIPSQHTFVSDVASILSILLLDDGFQMMINLGSHFHGFFEGLRSDRQNHELLHGQLVARVAAAVDDVEGGHRQDDVVVAGQIGDVPVQRHALFGGAGLADGQGDTENGIGAEFRLIFGAIELQHEFVDALLIGFVEILRDQSGTQHRVDVLDGF